MRVSPRRISDRSEPLFDDDFIIESGTKQHWMTPSGTVVAPPARTRHIRNPPVPSSLRALMPRLPDADRDACPHWGFIGVFDLETTGVDVTQDRIVSAHVGLLDACGDAVHHSTWLADPGVPIPEGASAVHGISTEHARRHGRPASVVVGEIVRELKSYFAAGIPVVAYNAPFDFSLLKHEAIRHGHDPILQPSPVIDPLVVDKTFDRYRPGKRTLDAVAAHYRVDLAHAHDASADAVAAGRVAQAIAARFTDSLPPTAAELHAHQVGWARAQAESLTEYFIKIGRITAHETLDGAWPIR